jgi:hypothetical protein
MDISERSEAKLYEFLTYVLDGRKWSSVLPGKFNLEEDASVTLRMDTGLQRGRFTVTLIEFKPRIPDHPVGGPDHYTY